MRILQVLDKLSVESGVCEVLMNYYRFLDKESYQFDFMINEAPDQKLYKEITGHGGRIYQMPGLAAKSIIRYQKKLQAFFAEHKEYQIIHGHMGNAAAFYMKEAKKAGIPIRILHAHNAKGSDVFWKNMRNRILSNRGIQESNAYAACGRRAAQYLFGTSERVKIITNAVDPERYRYDEKMRKRMRQSYHVTDGFVIGHIGRFCPQKNQAFLVEVLEELVKQKWIKHVYLLLIGAGGEWKKIEKKISLARLRDHVILTGAVHNPQDYFQMMDCFVLPSLFEGVPLVGVEAQMNGLPCLFSSEVTREIESDQTKYLNLQNKREWVEALRQIREKKRMSPALKEYDITNAVKGLQLYYEELLKTRKQDG